MSWWRSQRLALMALAVAAIAATGAYVWLDLVPSLRQPERVVNADASADVVGQILSLGSARWNAYEAPEGYRTLSIRLGGSGGLDSELCTITTLTDRPSGRTWLPSRDGLDVPYGEGEHSCISSAESYRILLVFLLPADAEGPFDLDIGTRSDLARFDISP